MKTWIAGLLVTIALICLLAAVWEPGYHHWVPLTVTAFVLGVAATALAGSALEDQEKESDAEGGGHDGES